MRLLYKFVFDLFFLNKIHINKKRVYLQSCLKIIFVIVCRLLDKCDGKRWLF
jgi:hypothetical protein